MSTATRFAPARPRFARIAVAVGLLLLAGARPAPAAQGSGASATLVGFLAGGRGAVFALEDAQRGVVEVVARGRDAKEFDRLALPTGAGATWSEAAKSPEARGFLGTWPVVAPAGSPPTGAGVVASVDARDEAGTNPLEDGAPIDYTVGVVRLSLSAGGTTRELAAIPFRTVAVPGRDRAALLRDLDRTLTSWSPEGTLVAVSGHLATEYPAPQWDRWVPVQQVAPVAAAKTAPPRTGAAATPEGAARSASSDRASTGWGCDSGAGPGNNGALAGVVGAMAVALVRRVGLRRRPS